MEPYAVKAKSGWHSSSDGYGKADGKGWYAETPSQPYPMHKESSTGATKGVYERFLNEFYVVVRNVHMFNMLIVIWAQFRSHCSAFNCLSNNAIYCFAMFCFYRTTKDLFVHM